MAAKVTIRLLHSSTQSSVPNMSGSGANWNGVVAINQYDGVLYYYDSRDGVARSILHRAVIGLEKLSPAGASAGDAPVYNGTSWLPTALASASDYLPLAGGTMTGDITMSQDTQIAMAGSGTPPTDDTTRSVLRWGASLSDNASTASQFNRVQVYRDTGGNGTYAGIGVTGNTLNFGSQGDIGIDVFQAGAKRIELKRNGENYVTGDTFFNDQVVLDSTSATSATNPALTFEGAGNTTGIYSPGTGVIAASTDGTERLRIASSGEVQLRNGQHPGTLEIGRTNSTGSAVAPADTGTINFPNYNNARDLVSIVSVGREANYLAGLYKLKVANASGVSQQFVIVDGQSQYIALSTNATERLRLTNSDTIVKSQTLIASDATYDSTVGHFIYNTNSGHLATGIIGSYTPGTATVTFRKQLEEGASNTMGIRFDAPVYGHVIANSSVSIDKFGFGCYPDNRGDDVDFVHYDAGKYHDNTVFTSDAATEFVDVTCYNAQNVFFNATGDVVAYKSSVSTGAANSDTWAFYAAGNAKSQFNGQVLVANGASGTSYATPSIGGTTSADAGVNIGTDVVSLVTDGLERVRVSSAGTLGINGDPSGAIGVYLRRDFDADYGSTYTGTSQQCFVAEPTYGAMATSVQSFRSSVTVTNPNGTTVYNYNVAPGAEANNGTITTQIGLHVNDLTLGNAQAARLRVNERPDAQDQWNLYIDGTAPNYISSKIHIGSTGGTTDAWVPSIGFINDEDSGIGRLATDTFSIIAGGKEVARFNDTKGIGVGGAGVDTAAIYVQRAEHRNNSIGYGVRSPFTGTAVTTACYGFFDQAQAAVDSNIASRTAFMANGMDLVAPGPLETGSTGICQEYRGFAMPNPALGIPSVSGAYFSISLTANSTRYVINSTGSAPSRHSGKLQITDITTYSAAASDAFINLYGQKVKIGGGGVTGIEVDGNTIRIGGTTTNIGKSVVFPNATGTDTDGQAAVIGGTQSTGTGTGGALSFQTCGAGSISGTTVNARTTRMTILGDGTIGMGTASPSQGKVQIGLSANEMPNGGHADALTLAEIGNAGNNSIGISALFAAQGTSLNTPYQGRWRVRRKGSAANFEHIFEVAYDTPASAVREVLRTSNDEFVVSTGGAERLEVTNSGTTVTGDLTVTGNITGSIATSSTSPLSLTGADTTGVLKLQRNPGTVASDNGTLILSEIKGEYLLRDFAGQAPYPVTDTLVAGRQAFYRDGDIQTSGSTTFAPGKYVVSLTDSSNNLTDRLSIASDGNTTITGNASVSGQLSAASLFVNGAQLSANATPTDYKPLCLLDTRWNAGINDYVGSFNLTGVCNSPSNSALQPQTGAQPMRAIVINRTINGDQLGDLADEFIGTNVGTIVDANGVSFTACTFQYKLNDDEFLFYGSSTSANPITGYYANFVGSPQRTVNFGTLPANTLVTTGLMGPQPAINIVTSSSSIQYTYTFSGLSLQANKIRAELEGEFYINPGASDKQQQRFTTIEDGVIKMRQWFPSPLVAYGNSTTVNQLQFNQPFTNKPTRLRLRVWYDYS